MVQREAAYVALTERVESALLRNNVMPGPWQVQRTYRDFDDPQVVQPACLVVVRDQRPIERSGYATQWELGAGVLVYFQNRNPRLETDTAINSIIDSIVNSLKAIPNEIDGAGEMHTTLGGTVLRAWIDGQLGIFQGLPEDQTVIVIPVTMLAV